MSRRSKCLEQKHPEVRHEIAGYAVVRAVKQNPHDTPLKTLAGQAASAQTISEGLASQMCLGSYMLVAHVRDLSSPCRCGENYARRVRKGCFVPMADAGARPYGSVPYHTRLWMTLSEFNLPTPIP